MRTKLISTFFALVFPAFAFADSGSLLHVCGDIELKYAATESVGEAHYIEGVDANSNRFWVEDTSVEPAAIYPLRIALHSEGGDFFIDNFRAIYNVRILKLSYGPVRGAFFPDGTVIPCEFNYPIY